MASSSREDGKILPTYWQILDAARELFAKNGFRDTTIRMISKKAKVNGASVNYYFRSKSALYEAIFHEAFEKMGKPTTGLVSTVVDQKTWEAAVDAWVTFMLTLFLKEDPEISLVRQLVAQGLQHAEAANAAVENADRRAARGRRRCRDGALRGGLPLSHA